MKKQNYIDLHCHPCFKSNFKDPDKRWNNWVGLELRDVRNSTILVSQSSLSQILISSNLVVVPLHPVEPSMIDNYLIRIGDLILNALDTDQLNSIINNNPSSYKLLCDELTNLQELSPTGQKVKILNKLSEYDEMDLDTLHVILAVEGPHSFYDDENRTDNLDIILNRFTNWLEEGHFILYLSLTHLTYGIFSNHAYGNKILPKKKMLPKGFGIRNPQGSDLIDSIYSNKVIIDLKHMSLVAREMFYKYHNDNWSTQPIICSHCAVTGFSWNRILEVVNNKAVNLEKIELWKNIVKIEYKTYYDPVRNIPYYPLSINLYDEDIIYIIKSKGLICLEFDSRILGEEVKHAPKEFLSKEEFEYWTKHHPDTKDLNALPISEKLDKEYEITIEDSDEEFENFEILIGKKPEYLIRKEEERVAAGYYEKLFVNQLLHIWEVINNLKSNSIKVWEHIAIGSDFDGLIESMPICSNASKMDDFAENIQLELEKTVREYSLDLGEDTTTIINNIFRQNALKFIKRRFNEV